MSEVIHTTVGAARQRLGITQEELAAKLGVSRQTVIAIERGRYTPSVLLALKVARFFKKPVEELFAIRHEK